MEEAYWTQYYLNHERQPVSKFAEWVKPRIIGTRVFDIGAGDQRDTAYLDAIPVDPVINDDFMTFADKTPSRRSDTVYARWFIHAVPLAVEERLYDWTVGQLFLEARIDPVADDGHYRRIVDEEALRMRLVMRDYHLVYWHVARGFSPLGDDDPWLLRVEAIRDLSWM